MLLINIIKKIRHWVFLGTGTTTIHTLLQSRCVLPVLGVGLAVT